ncbi:MAG: hypothetical protein ACKVZJ_14575 [Phycisphaerales bacterium]
MNAAIVRPSLFRGLLSALIVLVLQTTALCRPAGPDATYDRYLVSIGRQAETLATRLDRTRDRLDASIQRQVERGTSDAKLIRTINTSASSLSKQIQSSANALIKSATASKRSLERMVVAAERRGDDDAASEASDLAEVIQGHIDTCRSETASILSKIEQYRAEVTGSDDVGEAYVDAAEELSSDFDAFYSALEEAFE